MELQELEEGDAVTISYVAVSPLRQLKRGRTEISGTVDEVMGPTVYATPDMASPDDHDLQVVLDDDGELWARERGKPSTDGLLGKIARVED